MRLSTLQTSLYCKYSIVVGQTKVIPVIQEKRQNAVENILSIARELRDNAATHANSQKRLEKVKSNQSPAKLPLTRQLSIWQPLIAFSFSIQMVVPESMSQKISRQSYFQT